MTLTKALVDVPAYLCSKWQTSRMLQAAAWSTSLFIVGQILRIAANLIVTRLLVPEMFGLISIVLIIQTMLVMLCDIGLLPIVMRSKRGDDEDFLNTVWTVQIVRGVGIWIAGLLVAASLLVAGNAGLLPQNSVWHAPQLPAVMAVSIFTAVIGGLQSTKVLTAYRQMNVRQIALLDFATQLANMATMIMVAWSTRSVWSLVAAAFVSAVVSTLLSHFWLPGPDNRLAWDRATLREIYGAGGWILLASLAFVASVNADRLLMAGYIDATTLGLYAIAFNLIAVVEVLGQRLVGSVLQPALNEAGRISASAMRATLHAQRLVFDTCYLFMGGMLFALAPTLVAIMYDDRYAQAGHILQVLSCLLIFSRYNFIIGSVYTALGKPHLMAALGVIKLVSILVLLPLGYHFYGFEGALIAIVLHQLPCIFVIFWINQSFNLNNMGLELKVLPGWLAGYGLGLMTLGIWRLVHR